MSSVAKILYLGVIFLALCGATGLADEAPGFCSPSISGFGLGNGWWPWNLYSREHIPYYSLHPPVYYSVPLPRTYGYSPFAYPPGTPTPDLALPAPLTVPNPHVPAKPEAKPTSHQVARAPLRIQNPFVVQSAAVRSDRLTAHETPRPQVVFPARLQ